MQRLRRILFSFTILIFITVELNEVSGAWSISFFLFRSNAFKLRF